MKKFGFYHKDSLIYSVTEDDPTLSPKLNKKLSELEVGERVFWKNKEFKKKNVRSGQLLAQVWEIERIL